ncbi:hypothetical protein CPB86DRAFT_10899 [Serendipita vermifera]|nr:hypothetical protein CPB86DRAFT_10899 [Serendipita vermifera]
MFLVASILVAVAKYFSPQQPQIANWFEEYYRMWGISFDDLTNVAFRVSWFPMAAQLSLGRLQFRPVDHAFADSPVELGDSKRRMSSSDASSTGIAMTSRPRRTLGSPVGAADPSSTLLSTGQIFAPENREDMTRSLTGMLGHLNARNAEMNLPFISDKKWVMEGAGNRERLGTLSASTTAGGVARVVSSSSLQPRRGFIGESLPGVELSALPTGGYTGRPIVDFGSDGQSIGGSPHASSSRSGSGVGPFLHSFEGDSHTRNMTLTPSMGQDFPFSIGPQPQYRSTPPSTSPYHDNLSDDADMTINADIAWLSGNEDIMQ